MRKQKPITPEQIDKDYKVMSNALGRIIEIAYKDKTQLRRLKSWYNIIGLAMKDIEEEKKNARKFN